MVDPLVESYEAFPYNSKPIAVTEIGSMAALALLYGVTTAPPDCARVLELGCASGGNLIPMAYRYPGSRFTGIDLAPGQIAAGQREIAALGLENITLDVMSIADITDDFGMFDFIICHGVYSWVPLEVQEMILRVCARNLSPTGIAYVSYNTLPGWHVRGMVREMVMYHDDPSLPGLERVGRAREFVDLLVSEGKSQSVHTVSIVEEALTLKSQEDAHFIHEQLEPYNTPVYFAEFARRAAGEGLRFLAEARLTKTLSIAPEWAERAAGGAEHVVRVQQYMDFAAGRTFRRTLLCHETVAGRPQPSPDVVPELHLVLRAVPTDPAPEDAARPGVEAFKATDDTVVTTNHPMILAAFHVLLRVAPGSLPFDELLRRVNDRLSVDEPPGIAPPSDRSASLADALLQCALGGLIEFQRHPSAFTIAVSEHPVASRVARVKAAVSGSVPNLRHVPVELSALERAIIVHLDGSHDRGQLVDVLLSAIADGSLTPVGDTPDRALLLERVDLAFARFATTALLEA